jgi:hypothetical protein
MPPARTGAEDARALLQWLWTRLLWVAPVLVIGWLAWSFFGSAPEEQKSVEAMLASYTASVRPYLAPGRKPGAMDLKPWLQYFDSASRDFFEKNYQRMAVRASGGNSTIAQGADQDQLRLDAMAYAIRIPPLDGRYTVTFKQVSRPSEEVSLRLQTTAGEIPVRLVREGGAWRFADFMGQRARLVPGGGEQVK